MIEKIASAMRLRDLSAQAAREVAQYQPGTAEYEDASKAAKNVAQAAHRARVELESSVEYRACHLTSREADQRRRAERIAAAAQRDGIELTCKEWDALRQCRDGE